MTNQPTTGPAYSTAVEWFLANQRMTSYDPATQTPEQGALESAQDLAMAEQTASERGWWVGYQPDPEGDNPDDVTAVLYADGYDYGMAEPVVLAALGGIESGATDDRRRVIAAELALEAIADPATDADRVG